MSLCLNCNLHLPKNLQCSKCNKKFTWKKKEDKPFHTESFVLDFLNQYKAKCDAKTKNAVNKFNIPPILFDKFCDYYKLSNDFLDPNLAPVGFYDYDSDCEQYKLIKKSGNKKYKYLIIQTYYPKTFIVELNDYVCSRDAFKIAGIWLAQPFDKEYYNCVKSEINVSFDNPTDHLQGSDKVKTKSRNDYRTHTFYESYSTSGEYIEFNFGS
jgi:hypothetical protein